LNSAKNLAEDLHALGQRQQARALEEQAVSWRRGTAGG
jgi:hypothetical protein